MQERSAKLSFFSQLSHLMRQRTFKRNVSHTMSRCLIVPSVAELEELLKEH